MKCGAFNSSITVHPNGKVSPCCVFDFRYFKDITDIDLLNPWEDLKDGKGCSACKKPGDVYKNFFSSYLHLEKFELQHLDLRNNNTCNFECIICSELYSSKWSERLGNKNKFKKTNFNLPLTHVNRIYFAGGEPLLNPTHWEILDELKNPENVELFYSTNLSVLQYKTKSVFDYWSKFKKITLSVSLDAVGELGEELRYGLNMKNFVTNLRQVIPITETFITPTINLLNIWYLEDILEFGKKYNVEVRPVVLNNPDFLSISALPIEFKNKIPKSSNPQLNMQIDTDNSHLFVHTIAYILLQDKLKNTKVFEKMPFKDYVIKRILS